MLGTSTTEGDSFVANQNDGENGEELAKVTRKGSTVSSVTRQRSSSLSKCDDVRESRNRNVTGNDVFDDEAAGEVGIPARALSDSPNQIRRSSNGCRLLEARGSVEKSSSALDLRDIDGDSPTVFSHSDIASFMEYSAIQTTVRKVSRAFSGSSPPADKTPTSEVQMRTAQTRYIVESRNTPDKDTSASSSDSSQQNLEELLASIDRDLDETRRTISCAQLLESALLIKNDGRLPATESESTDSLRRRRRPRIIDFSTDKVESNSDEFSIYSANERNGTSVHSDYENPLRDETCSNSIAYSEQEKESNFSERTISEEKQDLTSSKESEQSQASVPSVGSESQGNQAEEPAHDVEDDNQPKKRVFELSADSNGDKNKSSTTIDEESSAETPAHIITPRKSSLPSVYNMARQYSRKVSEKQTVENIRMRARNKADKTEADTTVSDKQDNTDHTPKIKIEKVTKVSFSNTPIESYKLVRRRRRRSGSSRHRSDDLRRLSWSVEKVKPDSVEPRKTRPKSVYDMEALEATLKENMEEIEEGLEPMLIAGLEKDDVVVRGLVQHLVNKFNSKKSEAS